MKQQEHTQFCRRCQQRRPKLGGRFAAGRRAWICGECAAELDRNSKRLRAEYAAERVRRIERLREECDKELQKRIERLQAAHYSPASIQPNLTPTAPQQG